MMSNSLFKQSSMNKYIKKYDKQFTAKHSQKLALKKWITKLENGELKAEVANYGLFSRIILEDILGYDYEENVKENDKEPFGRGLSEFTLRKGNRRFMVIELKGSDTDLDKPQNRVNDKRTPIDQAFDYAKHSKDEGDIDWIFVSNYKEFRLYNWHKRQQKYISFMVEDLEDRETFKSFMLTFSKFSTVDHNLIEKLISKDFVLERNFEDEFYDLYSDTRLMLIDELEYLHPEFTRKNSVHYAQLILDRYIFICFAEDLGLLPADISIETIEKTVKDERLRGSEIWHDLNGLFIDVNEGSKLREEEIFGYNGGIFSENLEDLKIRDVVEDKSIFNIDQKWEFEEYSLKVEEKLGHYSRKINPIYKNLMTISSFDFKSELDVNILGHIFENSIGDIEKLKANQESQRKDEGIYYTPEYITDYICRNTIIPYLSKSGNATTVEKLVREYWGSEIKQLDEKVRNIKIVDPACGSGAFLNKASDVLLEIHGKIHEIEYKDDLTLDPYFDDIKERREILLNNIYGVDLNEESVEITKLAFFLKICKEGLKLPNLDKSIKCGNSLIDDPEYANEKTFNWEKAFPDVFNEGGFDIVIGNPPYGISFKEEEKEFLENEYSTFQPNNNYYVAFIQKGLTLTKNNGMFSYIVPNTFLVGEYFNNLKKYIINHTNVRILLDFGKYEVFEDPNVFTAILILQKRKNVGLNPENKFEFIEILEEDGLKNNSVKKSIKTQEYLESLSWTPKSVLNHNLSDITPKLDDIADVKDVGFNYWTKGRGKKRGGSVGSRVLYEGKQKNPKDIPYLKGRDFNRYGFINEPHNWLKYDYKDYLKTKDTFRFSPEYFENPKKLIYRQTADKLMANLDTNKYYLDKTVHLIVLKEEYKDKFDLKYILTIFNSKLATYFYGENVKEEGKTFAQVKTVQTKKIPIYPASCEEQAPLIEKADSMIALNKNVWTESKKFRRWLERTFKIEKHSKKLEKYYELDFEEFLNEVKEKKDTSISLRSRKSQEDLEKEFNKSLRIINPWVQKINEIDEEINEMVYDLYGLTPEERKIIEEKLG
ncbi:N-6 DNA Methylase [anaerobic digester metagenome]